MNTTIGRTLVVLSAITLSAVTIASAVKTSAAAVSSLTAAAAAQNKREYPVRGEINRSFQLAPNAQIDVSNIEGSVKVETRNDNRAEVHFARHARTQADYDCETILVQDSPNSLTIKHQTDRSCHVIQAYEELTLIVPQSANLRFTGLEGSFAIGNTDGYLELRNIEGSARLGEVQAAQIQNVEGSVTLSIPRLDSQGITVRAIEGSVELRVANDINADLRVRGADSVDVDLPNVLDKRLNTNSFRSDDENYSRRGTELQLGAGGAKILISAIEGHVRIRGL